MGQQHLEEIGRESYLDGQLSWLSRRRVQGHVESCESCRARLEALRARRGYLERMRVQLERLEQADDQAMRTGLRGEG